VDFGKTTCSSNHSPFSIPNLYDYASNKNLLVKDALAVTNLLDIFRLPMSRAAYNEYIVFRENLDSLKGDSDQTDIWVYHWSGGLYSSRQYYKYKFQSIMPPPPFCWIWKAKCVPRIKLFAWLLLVDRLNTRDML
jgi:hypothetical protein